LFIDFSQHQTQRDTCTVHVLSVSDLSVTAIQLVSHSELNCMLQQCAVS